MRWAVLGFTLLAAACQGATLQVVSAPAGARLRWTAPDSPRVHDAGVTPCRLELPAATGTFTLLLDAPGCRPQARELTPGELSAGGTLTVALPPCSLDDMPALIDPAGLGPLPGDERQGAMMWFEQACQVPAGDGAGLVVRLMPREETLEGYELWWLPFGAPAVRLIRDVRPRSEHETRVFYPDLDLSPDGKWLAWSCAGGEARKLQVRHRALPLQRSFGPAVAGEMDYPIWTPDGAGVAYRVMPPSQRGQDSDEPCGLIYLHRWDGGPDRLLARDAAPRFAFSPDGRTLACWLPAGLALVDVASGKARIAAPEWHGVNEPRAVQWSPDGRWVAAFAASGGRWRDPDGASALLLAPADGGPARELLNAASGCSWLPDSRGLYLSRVGLPSELGLARVECAAVVDLDGRVLGRYGAPKRRLETLAWAPDGRSLVAVAAVAPGRHEALRLGLDDTVTDLSAGRAGEVWEAVDTTAGTLVLSGQAGGWPSQGEGLLYRLANPPALLAGPLDSPRSLTASADGRVVALIVGPLARPQVLRGEPAAGPLRPVPEAEEAEQVSLSPDGRALALVGRDGRLRLLTPSGTVASLPARPTRRSDPQWLPDSSGVRPYVGATEVLGTDGTRRRLPPEPVRGGPWEGWEGKFGPLRTSPDGRWLGELRDGEAVVIPAGEAAGGRVVGPAAPPPLSILVPARVLKVGKQG